MKTSKNACIIRSECWCLLWTGHNVAVGDCDKKML
jgi:hypothetical protein